MNAETLNFLRYDASERNTLDFVPVDAEQAQRIRDAMRSQGLRVRLTEAEAFAMAQKRMEAKS